MGELLWAFAYAAGAIAAAGTAKVAFPVPATILNVTWEAVFVIWRPPRRRTTRAVYALWLALDSILLVQAWAWVSNSLVMVLGLLVGVAVHVVLYRRFRQPAWEAFALNAVMSLLFVASVLVWPQHLARSLSVAVSKLLGTGFISLANVVAWRAEGRRVPPGPAILMSIILLLDLVYVGLLVVGHAR